MSRPDPPRTQQGWRLTPPPASRLLLILGCTTVQQQADKIGTPINIEQATTVGTAPAAPAAKSNPYKKSPSPAPQSRPVMASPGGNTQPINSLNPYNNKWTIKVTLAHPYTFAPSAVQICPGHVYEEG